ncbi:MAG: thymidine phosphorylase [Propionibacteriaceae bacterium]|nr:thymidine phosphorylase [Propionibacteriaceae bacterium]
MITAKRDGEPWTKAQIDWVIRAYTGSAVAEEQMSALLMAVYFRGLNADELNWWTDAMIESGQRLDFSGLTRPAIDKHSTGGVGDKITLILLPLVASFGVAIPQLSGRGLGHTGGTLDKLESISGWTPAMTGAQMRAQLESVGALVSQADANLAPADSKLYALRDVTGTVASIPLIASSIMSKKIAEGTSGLVLDVKCGRGAFMTKIDQARDLARTMVGIGNDHGVRTTAVITDMSTPLGLTVGNALEVREAVEVLAGGGPPDVVDLTLALAREMLDQAAWVITNRGLPGAGIAAHSPEASRRAGKFCQADPGKALGDGRAMDTWRAMIAAQGGDPDARLPEALHTEDIMCLQDGYLTSLDALKVGVAAWKLGAGRARREDGVQAGAGVVLHAKPGDQVRRGASLMTLHANTPDSFVRAREALESAWSIGQDPGRVTDVVIDRIG